jgi:hypothetical protein
MDTGHGWYCLGSLVLGSRYLLVTLKSNAISYYIQGDANFIRKRVEKCAVTPNRDDQLSYMQY